MLLSLICIGSAMATTPGRRMWYTVHHGEVREMTIYPEEAGFLRSPCGLLQRLREIHS